MSKTIKKGIRSVPELKKLPDEWIGESVAQVALKLHESEILIGREAVTMEAKDDEASDGQLNFPIVGDAKTIQAKGVAYTVVSKDEDGNHGDPIDLTDMLGFGTIHNIPLDKHVRVGTMFNMVQGGTVLDGKDGRPRVIVCPDRMWGRRLFPEGQMGVHESDDRMMRSLYGAPLKIVSAAAQWRLMPITKSGAWLAKALGFKIQPRSLDLINIALKERGIGRLRRGDMLVPLECIKLGVAPAPWTVIDVPVLAAIVNPPRPWKTVTLSAQTTMTYSRADLKALDEAIDALGQARRLAAIGAGRFESWGEQDEDDEEMSFTDRGSWVRKMHKVFTPNLMALPSTTSAEINWDWDENTRPSDDNLVEEAQCSAVKNFGERNASCLAESAYSVGLDTDDKTEASFPISMLRKKGVQTWIKKWRDILLTRNPACNLLGQGTYAKGRRGLTIKQYLELKKAKQLAAKTEDFHGLKVVRVEGFLWNLENVVAIHEDVMKFMLLGDFDGDTVSCVLFPSPRPIVLEALEPETKKHQQMLPTRHNFWRWFETCVERGSWVGQGASTLHATVERVFQRILQGRKVPSLKGLSMAKWGVYINPFVDMGKRDFKPKNHFGVMVTDLDSWQRAGWRALYPERSWDDYFPTVRTGYLKLVVRRIDKEIRETEESEAVSLNTARERLDHWWTIASEELIKPTHIETKNGGYMAVDHWTKSVWAQHMKLLEAQLRAGRREAQFATNDLMLEQLQIKLDELAQMAANYKVDISWVPDFLDEVRDEWAEILSPDSGLNRWRRDRELDRLAWRIKKKLGVDYALRAFQLLSLELDMRAGDRRWSWAMAVTTKAFWAWFWSGNEEVESL